MTRKKNRRRCCFPASNSRIDADYFGDYFTSYQQSLKTIDVNIDQALQLLNCDHTLELINGDYLQLLRHSMLLCDTIPNFLELRGKINRYECLGKGPGRCFVNRSAMKLANIDYDFKLLSRYGDTFSFVDLCGGPGGFAEYLYRRCMSTGAIATGFGISLLHPHDSDWSSCNWNLSHLNSKLASIFFLNDDYANIDDDTNIGSKFFLINGPSGDGDILRTENVQYLSQKVNTILMKSIQNMNESSQDRTTPPPLDDNFIGVNLVMADGGSDEGRNSAYQEQVSFPLIVSEIICMLRTLRTGGDFVLKIYSCNEVSTS